MNKKLVLGINEKPKVGKWIALSFQHVFAMFGATILVPFLTGLPIGVALVASGIGTLIYIALTKAKVPVYLGSSFAYITAIATTVIKYGFAAAYTGLIVVGLIYVIVATIIKFTGKDWLNKVLPPHIIGPMIIIIGLTLFPVALQQASILAWDGSGFIPWTIFTVVALLTFAIAVLTVKFGKGFMKIVPILIGIVSGYIIAIITGVLDLSSIVFNGFFSVPDFMFIWNVGLDFSALAIFIPLSFVTIAEHIGDHTVLGQICDKDFLQDPGLDNTLMGDGIATAVSAMIGGPANTTYGENTGVVALTKVGSVWVTGLAAIFAILLGFLSPVTVILESIPSAVMGGISIILFGLIAYNGFKVIKTKAKFNWVTITIMVVMLYIGLSGMLSTNFIHWLPVVQIKVSDTLTIDGMALAAVVGILLNIVAGLLNLKVTEVKKETA